MRLPFAIPPRDTAPFDVVTLGLNSIDLVAVVERYPPANAKQPISQFARYPGGQMATAAAVCARLGWRARYIGSFGDDDLSIVGLQSLSAEHVDVSATWQVTGTTSQFAVIVVDESTGERTVFWRRDPSLTIAPHQVPRAAVESGRMLLVDCFETPAAIEATRHARAVGIPTVLDVEAVRDNVAELLRHTDAVIAAETFPTAFTGYAEPGRAIAAIAREYGSPLVAVTLGAEGSLVWCGGEEHHTPAFDVSCVDSTGAGDAFHGGFVAACLAQPTAGIDELMRYATAVAALNCGALGARGGMPTAAGVDAFLSSGPPIRLTPRRSPHHDAGAADGGTR